jgi:hypothetical protein
MTGTDRANTVRSPDVVRFFSLFAGAGLADSREIGVDKATTDLSALSGLGTILQNGSPILTTF